MAIKKKIILVETAPHPQEAAVAHEDAVPDLVSLSRVEDDPATGNRTAVAEEAGSDPAAAVADEPDAAADVVHEDVLFGTEASDTLGAAHAMQIFAGGGDDMITTGSGVLMLDAGEGYDRVTLLGETGFHDAYGLLAGWTGVEEIIATDFGDEINAGLPIADQIGLVIDMAGGNDTVIATSGADTITGGAGSDTLTGGAGADVFKFSASDKAIDVITDFTSGVDHIDFAGVSFANLAIADTAEGASICAGGQTVVLQGVLAATLSAGDFVI